MNVLFLQAKAFINNCITPHPIFFLCVVYLDYNSNQNLHMILRLITVQSENIFKKYHENTSTWKKDYYEFRWVLVVTCMLALKVPILHSSPTLSSPPLSALSPMPFYLEENALICIKKRVAFISCDFLQFSFRFKPLNYIGKYGATFTCKLFLENMNNYTRWLFHSLGIISTVHLWLKVIFPYTFQYLWKVMGKSRFIIYIWSLL